MENCLFCQIVSGEADRFLIYEDDATMAFLDIFPISHGHLLIVGKNHAENIFEMTEAELAAVAKVSLKLSTLLKDVLNPDGLMVAQLNGAAAGQTVFHYHMHLIPRQQCDSMDIHTRVPGDRVALGQLQQQLRQALGTT